MILSVLEFVCRLVGLAEWFEQWQSARIARTQAQYEANAPKTLSELEHAQREDDF